MHYVLTEDGVKNGYGRPVDVFHNKLAVEEYIIRKFRRDFNPEHPSIKTIKTGNNTIEIRITGHGKDLGCTCYADYELFEIDELGKEEKDKGENYFKEDE